MQRSALAIAAALTLAAGAAQADNTFTWEGDLTGAPTWDRPFSTFSGISSIGSGVGYQALEFAVTASGAYDFLSTTDGWDNFTFLYSPAFDPAQPLVNGLIGNDDRGGLTTSGFIVELTAGVNYIFVTTAFAPSDFGAFTNTITGPGTVNVVPEPGTYVLMALGLAGIGAWVRRRRTDAANG
jgi:hypothetical protein